MMGTSVLVGSERLFWCDWLSDQLLPPRGGSSTLTPLGRGRQGCTAHLRARCPAVYIERVFSQCVDRRYELEIMRRSLKMLSGSTRPSVVGVVALMQAGRPQPHHPDEAVAHRRRILLWRPPPSDIAPLRMRTPTRAPPCVGVGYRRQGLLGAQSEQDQAGNHPRRHADEPCVAPQHAPSTVDASDAGGKRR